MVVPTLCIVGKSGSGKTTLLEALIPELKALGHRVAVVKHSPHGSDLDVEAKDSWRLLKSGGDVVLLSGPGQVAQFRRVTGDSTLEELASHVWDTDIFLAERFHIAANRNKTYAVFTITFLAAGANKKT